MRSVEARRRMGKWEQRVVCDSGLGIGRHIEGG